MPPPSTNEIIAFWLMPAKPFRKYFDDLIRLCAAKFNAPVFSAHLTIFVCAPRQMEVASILRDVFGEMRALALKVRGVSFSQGFTKTLFVEFEATDELQNISDRISAVSGADERYLVDPHVSLLYQTLPRAVKKSLAASCEIPWREISFDRAEAISTPVPITTRAEVDAWKTLAGYSFAAESRAG